MSEISIIVPIYNVERYVKKSLNSLINQTFRDIEIICIDDCSPDNSRKIVEEIAAKDSRIKLIINEKNIGLSQTRNKGIQLAQSPYIMFLDPDDWYDKDACEVLYKEITKKNVDIALFGTRMVYSDHTEEYPKGMFLLEKDIVTKNNTHLLYKLNWPVWNKIWKKKIIDKYNITYPINQNFEDAPFYFKYMAFVNEVSIIKKPRYNYLQRPDSIVGEMLKDKNIKDLMYYVMAVEDVYKFYLKHNILDEKKISVLVLADRFISDVIKVVDEEKHLLLPIVDRVSKTLNKIDFDIEEKYAKIINLSFLNALRIRDYNSFLKKSITKRKLFGLIKIEKTKSKHLKTKKVTLLNLPIFEKLKKTKSRKIKLFGIIIFNKSYLIS